MPGRLSGVRPTPGKGAEGRSWGVGGGTATHRGAPWGTWSLTRRFLAKISTLGPWEERTVRPQLSLGGAQGA